MRCCGCDGKSTTTQNFHLRLALTSAHSRAELDPRQREFDETMTRQDACGVDVFSRTLMECAVLEPVLRLYVILIKHTAWRYGIGRVWTTVWAEIGVCFTSHVLQ